MTTTAIANGFAESIARTAELLKQNAALRLATELAAVFFGFNEHFRDATEFRLITDDWSSDDLTSDFVATAIADAIYGSDLQLGQAASADPHGFITTSTTYHLPLLSPSGDSAGITLEIAYR